MEKTKIMKVIIKWVPEEEGSEILMSDKLWNFTTDNFNGEIPFVDDKMLLNLPSEDSFKGYEPWKFKVVQRIWEPENSTIHLKVKLANPQEFLDLSEEEKAYLADRLNQEGFDRRPRRPKFSLEAAHVNTSKEQEIPEPRRPKPNLQKVHISQAIEKQKTPDLESATPKSYQEIIDATVHSRKRRQFDMYETTFTQIDQQGC